MLANNKTLFQEGIEKSEVGLGAEVRDYDRALWGVANVLSGGNGNGSPPTDAISELASLFHDPLSMVSPLRMSVDEIAFAMESVISRYAKRENLDFNLREVLDRKLPYLFASGKYGNEDELEKWVEQLERELVPGESAFLHSHKLADRIAMTRKYAANLSRKIEIVESLAGRELATLRSAKDLARDLLAASNHLEAAAFLQIQHLKDRIEELPRERALELKPLDELKTRVQKGWDGNFAEEGEFLTDGRAILRRPFLRKADARTLDSRVPDRIQTGEIDRYPQSKVGSKFWEEANASSEPVRVLGWRPDSACQDDVAYVESGKAVVAYINAHRLAAIIKRIRVDEIRIAADQSKLLFMSGDDVAAILMPYTLDSIGRSTMIEMPADFPSD